jgi:hypothetical protein
MGCASARAVRARAKKRARGRCTARTRAVKHAPAARARTERARSGQRARRVGRWAKGRCLGRARGSGNRAGAPCDRPCGPEAPLAATVLPSLRGQTPRRLRPFEPSGFTLLTQEYPPDPLLLPGRMALT